MDIMEEGVGNVNVVLWPFSSLICKLLKRDIPPLKEVVKPTPIKAELYFRI